MGLHEGKTLLIVNPAAQRGHGAEHGRVALRLLRALLGAQSLDAVYTDESGHAVDIGASAGEYRNVVTIGGDGLVHEVVNGLMRIPQGRRPALGVVPTGSGNDFARSLGMPKAIDRAIAALETAPRHHIDVGSCNGEYFDETLSFGLDAGIALGTVDLRTRIHMGGTPLYLASGVNQLLFHLDSYHFQATLDGGREIGGETPMIAVQLGPTYGGGFRICPDAKLDDGLFDLCWADTASLPRATYIFLRAKNGKHVNYPEIHFERASSIHLEFDRRPPVQMDGEAHIAESYDIRLHPHALEVLAPALR